MSEENVSENTTTEGKMSEQNPRPTTPTGQGIGTPSPATPVNQIRGTPTSPPGAPGRLTRQGTIDPRFVPSFTPRVLFPPSFTPCILFPSSNEETPCSEESK